MVTTSFFDMFGLGKCVPQFSTLQSDSQAEIPCQSRPLLLFKLRYMHTFAAGK
jgi:hypothetical protein